MSKEISRRAFLKSSAAVAAAGLLGACASNECAPCETTTCAPCAEPTSYNLGDDILTIEDINNSIVELNDVTDFAREINCDVVVAGAGAAGMVAAGVAAEAGVKTVLLQKESIPVSQGNCASAIIKGGSTELGLRKWVHECTAFNSWRSNPALLNAYIDNSEDALNWVLEHAGVTEATGWKNENTTIPLTKYQDTSAVFTGVVHDATQTYDYGTEKVEMFAPWFGPKPNNIGTVAQVIVGDLEKNHASNFEVLYSTPIVKLIQDASGKVTGCIAKDEDDKFIKINASKGVILATGGYENNVTMCQKYCPDIVGFDKKVYHRTGDGNILAILAGGHMEEPAHSTVMHDFDAGLMYDEPFLYVNMEGNRFTNEDCEMAYMGKQLRYQPRFTGENMSSDNSAADGSLGWYCQIYDSAYMSYAKSPVPEFVMARYLKEEDPSKHTGVFTELIDTFRADTLEELATKLGVPAANLVAAVTRYNELCESGADVDFGKNKEYMNKLVTPPYWGTRRHIRCSSVTAGVKTDAEGRVVTNKGKVVPGLWAAGNLGGQFFGAPDYPFFQTGLSLGHAFTSGYICGKSAIK